MKKLKKTILVLILVALTVYSYDHLMLAAIPVKKVANDVRIGYINLHQNKITEKDLKKLKMYDCDIWLFLEWNGNNFDQLPEFTSTYFRNFELKDDNTFGVLVLSKDSTTHAEEIGIAQRPYACDYPKHLIKYTGLNIYLNHAPPPVPGCNFETGKYISDLIKELTPTESEANIIIGDFNALPIKSGIKNIKLLGYKDSYNSLHTLPVGTFGPAIWLPKILKFDYVFHKGNLLPMMVERFSVSTSDHTGWVADFRLK